MTKKTTTTTTAAFALYEQDTAAVLRNAASRTYTPLIRELQNARGNDRAARNFPHIAAEMDEIERELTESRAELTQYDQESKRKSNTDQERAQAAQTAATIRRKISRLNDRLHTLERAANMTLSERADIVQECALAALEQPTERERNSAADKALNRAALWAESAASAFIAPVFYLVGGEWQVRDAKSAAFSALAFITEDDDTQAAIVESDSRRRHRQNKGGAYIHSQRGGNIVNTTRTKATPTTAEERDKWQEQGREFNKVYECNGYTVAIEWRESKGNKPAGYYRVERRRTVRDGFSYEQMADDGTIEGINHTRNTYADTLAAVEQLADLASRANLTDRDRQFLAAYCTADAREVGEQARRAYLDTAAARDMQPSKARIAADKAQYKARRKYALQVVGIATDGAQRAFFSRLCDKLTAADNRTTAEPLNLAADDFQYWEHIARTNRGTAAADGAERADLLGAILTAAERKTAADIVKWRAVIKWGETMTPTERAAADEQRAAERAAYIAEHSRIDNTTAAAIERAAKAAAAYAEKHAPSAADRRAAALAELEKSHADSRARWAAEWSARPTHTITAAEWNAMSADSRAALLDTIHASGKRLEFAK